MKLIRRFTILILALLLVTACTGHEVKVISNPTIQQQDFVAEMPEWNTGDRWIFRWKLGWGQETYPVIVEDVTPSGYVLLERGVMRRYFTLDFAYLAAVQDDEIITQHTPPLPLLKFPLKAGMQWRQGDGAAYAGNT